MKNDHMDEINDARLDGRREQRDTVRDAAFDDALTQAFRAEDPGAAFTQRVLARAREERAAAQAGRPPQAAATLARFDAAAPAGASASPGASVANAAPAPPSRGRTQRLTATRKLIAALAASLTLAAAGAQWLQHRRYVAEGERARAQVLAALRLTNQKLDIVHHQITGREHAR